MKIFLNMFALAVMFALTACSNRPGTNKSADPLIVRAHFVGTDHLFAAPESAKLKELWNLKSSVAFRNEAFNRFASLPALWAGKATPTLTNLFRPLLDDLAVREFYLDSSATPEFLLAAQLPANRARIWETNFLQAINAWKLGKPSPINADSFTGWELRNAGLSGAIRFLRASDWVVVSVASGPVAREGQLLGSIKATGRPGRQTGAWLEGDANLARFDSWFPALSNFQNLPVAHFALSNRSDFVRTYATLDFPRPHGWKFEPWQVPTNLVREPLISFVAMRGIAPVLESFKSIRDLGYQPTPNQIVGWGHRMIPFQFTYVAPSHDVRSQLKKVEPKLAEEILGKNGSKFAGRIDWATNGQEIIWRGLPLAVPHLGALRESGQEFLGLSCFPPVWTSNMAPPELYQQLYARNDLVSFDFELTEFRIPHWRQFYQILEIGTRRALTATNVPSEKFLTEIAPKLGEAVTELRANSPTQMTLVRKSQTGLTALELVSLSRWIESTNFPAFGVFGPAPARRVASKNVRK